MYFCLHHGKPAVVLPFDFDQFDNAARLEKAGLALRARSTAALEAAILQALGDPSLRSRCEAMSTIVRRSDALPIFWQS
jgi:UDP:flavonoid glycosyltransferase YjiC (YdhE family)